MAKPNENFKLNTRDIELIESALFLAQEKADDAGKREIQNLRAKLHHQKVWYRPQKDYVSG
jgi:hypothetical protein